MPLSETDALIVVDVQKDFLPGGSLAVPDGDAVVPILNQHLRHFAEAGLMVVATRDWHPPDHCSFEAQGGIWPPHCIRDTAGAAFADALQFPGDVRLISKATNKDEEAYSGFDGTELEQTLKDAGIRRVFIGGLATDYCVLATVNDALQAGFEVIVLDNAIRAVNVKPGDGEAARAAMRAAGATFTDLETLNNTPG